jgi:hypothetical protein
MAHELATQPHDLSSTIAEERIKACQAIIEKIGKIKYEMGRDKPLLYDSINHSNVCPVRDQSFCALGRPIDDDGGPSVQLFNEELAVLEAQGKNTWFTAPWLYAESVLFPHRPVSFYP